MKKIISVSLAVFTVLLTMVVSAASFSAEESKLNINGVAEAKVGDKLTYTIYIADVPEKTEDIQMDIYYDSSKLSVDKDSISYIEGGSPVYNAESIDGQILFNSANGLEGWDLKEKTKLFEVSFNVNEGGETDLSYYIECMDYLSNSTSIDEYTITCSYSVNDEVVADEVPKVNENGSGGDFANYKNGKGVKNGGDEIVGSASNGVQEAAAAETNGNADANDSQNETTVVLTNSSGEALTNPDGTPVTQTKSDATWRYIIISILAAAIICCIVIKVVLDKRKNQENNVENAKKEK